MLVFKFGNSLNLRSTLLKFPKLWKCLQKDLEETEGAQPIV